MAHGKPVGKWFMIEVTWGAETPSEVAADRFYAVYRYLFRVGPPDAISKDKVEKIQPIDLNGKNDPRRTIVADSLKSIYLDMKNRFVMVLQIYPEDDRRVIDKIKGIISHNNKIKVEDFPARYVHELIGPLPIPEKPPDLGIKLP